MKRRNYRKVKGSLTVEASLILSMTVILAGLMLSLCFHVYQRCWYTQAACETVLSGSSNGVLYGASPLKEAESKWNILREECGLIPVKLSASVSGDDRKICHKVTAKTAVWGWESLEFETEASQKILRPVKFIRKIAAVKEGKE